MSVLERGIPMDVYTITQGHAVIHISEDTAEINISRDPEHEPDTPGHIPADVLEALADLATPALDKPANV